MIPCSQETQEASCSRAGAASSLGMSAIVWEEQLGKVTVSKAAQPEAWL